MKITKFIHKGLKNLYEEDVSPRVFLRSLLDKLQKMLSFLEQMGEPEELRSLASWKAHTLTGDRKGVWSLSVTGNLRLTFFIDLHRREIRDVDLEDYH